MINWFKNIGPGVLVAAAFIGPGTVTVCTLAGVNFGYTLLWAMTLSIIATVILQEMAARVGIITQKGLADIIKEQIKFPWLKKIAIILILSAIVIGNAAYEAGNISGASLGISAIVGESYYIFYPISIGIIAFALLYIGNYKILERSLVVLVLTMSISFVLTAIITKPDISLMFKGILIPSFPKGSMLTIIGLIGTTVVPYNLFLHASLVKEKWKKQSDLTFARKDTYISIILGGFVSMAIIIAATSIQGYEIKNGIDLAKGLEPLYGNFAKYFLGIGLFAAGITSAITAPLAAAYVANSCFGWNASLKSLRFRFVWFLILALGVLFSSLKINPIEIIKFAQVANGILLPVIALFLVWIVNKTAVLGTFKNGWLQNVFAGIIILITMILGFKSILKVFELL
ncbi:MAG: Nramp family divalent metal transporter [Lutibacter sp.]|uniref:Nramp family divalent metal transporter n=1 Tax=Lutibacter sp. TaxID=1925666 RepID=UPI0018445765|nr:Nramp family divalent metal transporter [Lutibacter sp.]MBT8317327.1 Nramp family divalent metal transporter [Lutibacter sp.]NNJ58186.1 Nramp family divalent metal transporter [Lutibacter sp.]